MAYKSATNEDLNSLWDRLTEQPKNTSPATTRHNQGEGKSSGGQELKLQALSFVINFFVPFLVSALKAGTWRVKYTRWALRFESSGRVI